MKDPDDMTYCGAMGPNFSSLLGNLTDSLMSGNIFDDYIKFYPKDYLFGKFAPTLTVYSSIPTGAKESSSLNPKITVNGRGGISIRGVNAGRATVYNMLGQKVNQIALSNGDNQIRINQRGVFIVRVESDRLITSRKVILR